MIKFDVENIDLAPLLIFVYDRKDKTKSLLESLVLADLIDRTELYIFSDGPKNKEAVARVEEVRHYIDFLDLDLKFKKIHFIKHEKNHGLAKSIIDGFTQVFVVFLKVIVIVYVNIVSSDFLIYMNYCLERYRGERTIGSIGGMSPLAEEDLPDDHQKDIYLLDRTCSFAWGTWAEVWDHIDWEVKDYKIFQRDKQARKRYNRSGNGSSYLLDAYMYGRVNSWAVRFDYSHFKNGQYTLYPKYSKVKNIGYDGSGTHYRRAQKLMGWEINVGRIDLSRNRPDEDWDEERIIPDERIQEAFRKKNMLPPLKLFLKYSKMYLLYFKNIILRKIVHDNRKIC